MVKLHLIIFLHFCLLLLVSCNTRGDTIITGEIANLEYPYVLASWLSADTLVIDTIPVNDKGKFSYNINIDTLTTFSLYLNNYESAAVVFADKGQKLKVRGDAHLPDLIRVNGNEINDDLTSFKETNESLLKQRGQLFLNLRNTRSSDSATSNSILKADELANLNLLNHELMLNAEEYIMDNPTKFSSLILISNFFMNSDNPRALERVLGYMQGDITETATALRLHSYSEKLNRSAEGAHIPYFLLTDKDDNTLRSSDFKDKYFLLSFISTSGLESRETVDLLKNEYEELSSDSVQFITFYIDSDIYPIEYLDQDSIPWLVVPEKRSWGSDVVDNLNVQYVPFNILVGPDGIIKARNVPAQEVADIIKNSAEN